MDESSIIFLYPELFLAISGINPVKSLNLNNIWVPIIGCVPIEDKVSENSRAPDNNGIWNAQRLYFVIFTISF